MTPPRSVTPPASGGGAAATRTAPKEKSGFPSLGIYAYEALRERIRSGSLRPGDRVREEEVARSLDISRTPVREALRRLESEGFLGFEPHKGMVVVRLDHQSIMELYVMREVLEGTAARLAAQHASDAELLVFRDLTDDESLLAADPAALARQNVHFHQALYRAAHNRYLLKALSALGDAMALIGGTTYAVAGRPGTAHSEHARIVSALSARDGEAAEAATRAHIRAAQRARLALLFDAAAPPA